MITEVEQAKAAVKTLEDKRRALLKSDKYSTSWPPVDYNRELNAINADMDKANAALTVAVQQAEQHAAVVARSPLQLKVGDLKDIVCLFEYAFAAKTLPTAEAIALNRLRALLRVLVKEAA